MTAYVNQPKNTYTKKETFVSTLTGYKFNPNAKTLKFMK